MEGKRGWPCLVAVAGKQNEWARMPGLEMEMEP